MTAEDTYKTIVEPSEGIYTEKRSKFIAIALPVRTLDEIKAHLETYQKKYYDARHVCYAYMLGAARKDFRANDNGEPSGTAGKPILGQINSNELTDILMFEYPFMHDIMRIVKEEEPEILSQSYDMDCSMTLCIRRSMMPKLRARLEKVETARILDEE